MKFLDENHCAKYTEIANQIKIDKKSTLAALQELVKEGRIRKELLVNLDNRTKKAPYYCSLKDPRLYRILIDNRSVQTFGHGYSRGIIKDASLEGQIEHKINRLVTERNALRKKLNFAYEKITHARPWKTDPWKIKDSMLARQILLLQLKKINSDHLNRKLAAFQTLQRCVMIQMHSYQNNPTKLKSLKYQLRKLLIELDDLYYAYVEANSKEMFSGLSKMLVVNRLLEMTIGQFAKNFDLSQKTISKIKRELYLDDGSINGKAIWIIIKRYTHIDIQRRILNSNKKWRLGI